MTGPQPQLDVQGGDLPVLTDPLGRSVPYNAHRFGFAPHPVTVHPWPTATFAW